MQPEFEIPKLWQIGMMLVSSNAGLHPQEVIENYRTQASLQAAAHPGYVDLNIGLSKQAAARGTKMIRTYYHDDDPGKISMMVIFVAEFDPVTKKPIPRLLTNTSLLHVLEEPCANCQLWVRVHTDVGPHAHQPYQLVPCCDKWADSVDFRLPVSLEELAVPAVATKLLAELRAQDRLLKQRQDGPRMTEERDRVASYTEDTGLDGLQGMMTDLSVSAAPFLQFWWAFVIAVCVLFFLALRLLGAPASPA